MKIPVLSPTELDRDIIDLINKYHPVFFNNLQQIMDLIIYNIVKKEMKKIVSEMNLKRQESIRKQKELQRTNSNQFINNIKNTLHYN